MKRTSNSNNGNSQKQQTTSGKPVQKVKQKSSLPSQLKMKKCPYYRKGFCLVRDDDCMPTSIRCMLKKKAYMNPITTSGLCETSSSKKATSTHRDYNPILQERYGINQTIKTINQEGKPIELCVFRGFLNLSKQYTTDYYVMIKDIKTRKLYKVLVAYNSRTSRYYISETQLKWLHKNHIYPNAIFHTCDDGSIPLVGIDFQEISKLAMYGYSAGKTGLCMQDRRIILKHILDNNIMCGYEIIEHLQGLIAFREQRTDRDFSVAINNWRQDIKFVGDYKVSKDRR